MKKSIVFCLISFLIFVLIVSCESDSTGPSEEQDKLFTLFGDYTNINGNNPQFEVNYDLTDPSITFDGNPDVTNYYNSVSIMLNNVSISKDGSNYSITTLDVEELLDNSWQTFVEFESDFSTLTNVAVVLVLDVSNSLGNEFYNVKEYAKEFAQIIFENSSGAYVGVVAFSSNITTLNLTNNYYYLEGFIDDLNQGQYTRMYDAMQTGINLLDPTYLDVEGYALVTFTDGIDNYSAINATDVINSLNNSPIKSFTMGLEGYGGVDEETLNSLAVNGEFEIVSSINDLEQTFEDFAESVSNVYNITYIRNDQIISDSRQIKFIFNTSSD